MQVQKLVEDGDWKELATIMAPRLEFGTAGIRGRMGAGFGRMNDLVIIQVGKIDYQIIWMFFSRCISRNGVIGNNISLPSISNRIKKFVKSHKIEK